MKKDWTHWRTLDCYRAPLNCIEALGLYMDRYGDSSLKLDELASR